METPRQAVERTLLALNVAEDNLADAQHAHESHPLLKEPAYNNDVNTLALKVIELKEALKDAEIVFMLACHDYVAWSGTNKRAQASLDAKR